MRCHLPLWVAARQGEAPQILRFAPDHPKSFEAPEAVTDS